MRKKLKKEILERILKKANTKENVIRSRISQIISDNPSLTINAAAAVYAKSKGLTVVGSLDQEDKISLSTYSKKAPAKLLEIQKKRYVRGKLKPAYIFVRYQAKNNFQTKHFEEVNKAYNAGCYTATFILCRKVIENLVIDLLIKRFKNKKGLYFDINKGRFLDFSVILKNLYSKRTKFPSLALKPIERLYSRAKFFSKDANDKTHSWYHIAKKSELDEMDPQEILDLISTIEGLI